MVEQRQKVPFTERDKSLIAGLVPRYKSLLAAQSQKKKDGLNIKAAREHVRFFRTFLIEQMELDPGSAANIDNEARRQALEPIRQRNVSNYI